MKATYFNIQNGLMEDSVNTMYPSRMWGVKGERRAWEDSTSTFFGCVAKGTIELKRPGGSFTLTQNMYFASPGPLELSGPGEAVVFERLGYVGLFQIGGPVESTGRLCYIDNCMTTVLAHPPRVGDPCLNLLSFPPDQLQTMHIHPSLRMGIVLAGSGASLDKNSKKTQLVPGMVFQLGIGFPHCFSSGPDGLLIIAYHPDSDVGPTDQSNPMLSRTYTKF